LSPNFRRPEIWLFSLWLLALAGTGYWVWRSRQLPEGPYGLVSLRLNEVSREFCDSSSGPTRLALSRVIDRLRPRIQALWAGTQATEFPEHKMEQVGPIFVRLSEKTEAKIGFESSSWSWEDARSIYLRTQNDPDAPETKQRWRDLDTAVKFLLERDVGRILRGREFLSPENTEHIFRPNPSVSREGKNFVVRLDAGEFRGAEKKLEKIFSAWSGQGHTLKIRWVQNDPDAYRMLAHSRSSRSYVNHHDKTMVIANFAWTRTLAHELGHILGFADHYYSVWNGRNCYYTQESRLSDLMSDSQFGRVTAEHWRIMDEAYAGKGLGKPFPYFFREKR
jgi:hypothetical protein